MWNCSPTPMPTECSRIPTIRDLMVYSPFTLNDLRNRSELPCLLAIKNSKTTITNCNLQANYHKLSWYCEWCLWKNIITVRIQIQEHKIITPLIISLVTVQVRFGDHKIAPWSGPRRVFFQNNYLIFFRLFCARSRVTARVTGSQRWPGPCRTGSYGYSV